MLVLRLERWPKGDARKAESLGEIRIANDMTGTDGVGNYQVTFKLPTGDPTFATINNFRRDASPRRAWQLVLHALARLLRP